MDGIEGMKELEDKSIDLCLTDPPYNINYKSRNSRTKQMYSDNQTDEEYRDFCKEWFSEALRVCKMVMFTPGNNNYWIYCQLVGKPKTQLIHYKSNSHGSQYLSHLNSFEIILVYGKYWDWQFSFKPFKRDVLIHPLKNGFLQEYQYMHPCPKSFNLWKDIIQSLNPSSVLDPFMGSGTTAEAAIQLGIPCYGFELMEEYAVDINKRIDRSKYYKKERKLDEFF